MKYKPQKEAVLFGMGVDEYAVPEIKITYEHKGNRTSKISSANDAAIFIRSLFDTGSIEVQEQFIVLYLDQTNTIKGFYKHTVGTINSVAVDPKHIVAGALNTLCVGVIIAYNHPSASTRPSEADRHLTDRLKNALNLLSVVLLDHLIITKDSHYSFADNSNLLSGIYPASPIEVRQRARIMLIETLLFKLTDKVSREVKLLRNGVIPTEALTKAGYKDEEEAIRRVIASNTIDASALTFIELTRFNTFFDMHKEKVAGIETFSSSRDFPVTIVGSKEKVTATIENGINALQSKPKTMTLSASDIRKRLLQLDGPGDNWYARFSGLDGLDSLETLGSLESDLQNELATSESIVISILEKSKHNSKSATLSFEEIIRSYNTGISEEEIKAWVYYKRSLGFPMKGWEGYYLPNLGEAHDELYCIKDTIIKDNHFRDLHLVSKGTLLGRPTKFSNEYDGHNYLVYTGIDSNKYYVKQSDTEVKKAHFKTDQKVLDALVQQGALYNLEGQLLPYPLYVFANLYDRELSLALDKEYIITTYGEKVYTLQKEVIEKAKPRLITITHPDPKERPRILSISKFAREFFVKELRVETGIEVPTYQEAGLNLQDAFKLFLRSLDTSSFKESTAYNIIHFYLEAHHLSKRYSEEEKEQIEKYAPLEGEELFSKFLHEAILPQDQQKIDFAWNREFNGQSSIQYHKIPVGFVCSSKFKHSLLEFTPAQREAVAFMEAVGSGVIAYDVGVGKTMSAIITVANALYQRKCKAPLIVVPNPTYKKWVREIIGYTDEKTLEFVPGVLSGTKVKVNEWYNLGTEVRAKIDLNMPIPEDTITVVTYEGFAKLGFSEKVMGQMFEHLSSILSQSEDNDKSQREKEKKFQGYREIIGLGLKDTIVDIDRLGIDYIVIDEAHNFKNIFSDVKSDEEGKKRFHLKGSQSTRAVKAFFLCNYIQKTFGQNVMLLTATPFTNSPLEVYSILSLVAHERMKQMGISNLSRFMETFVQQTLEYAPNYKEEIVTVPVVKSFNNRLVLQKLIYNHINYKTGEEAGVKRPCKINLPRLNTMDSAGGIKKLALDQQILTYLSMSPIQRANQEEIIELAKSGTGQNKNIIVALGQSLDNALSPFLYKHSLEPEDYIDFVESSPKIKYALSCIRTVKAYHEAQGEQVSGQIIYSNRGKDFFPLIKEYLEKQIGYKTRVKYHKATLDEVEIITSGISQERKENIKEAFLDGVVKIIIGTATIREGIDLQKKCANIYNLYPEWNPTDIRQLEGRAWRQGNEFGYIRVTMPLVENSMDVFVFQKLDEKMHRINDIWYRGDRGNVMDVESLDPEEVKFALFTNLKALAKLHLDKEIKDLTRRTVILESQIDTLKRFDFKVRKFFEYQGKCKERLKDLLSKYKDYFYKEKEAAAYKTLDWWKLKSAKDQQEFQSRLSKAIEETEQFLSASLQEDKELLRLGRGLYAAIKDTGMRDNREDVFSEFKAYLSEVRKAEKSILEQKGYTIHDNLQDIIASFQSDKAQLVLEKERVLSEEHAQSVYREVQKKKEKLSIQGKTIEDRVNDFASLNYLLDYKSSEVDSGHCMLPEVKQRPPVRKQDQIQTENTDSEREKRLKLARVRAQSIRIKLQLLNLD